MKHFTIIDGCAAILHSGGVYSQVDTYRRGDEVFAKKGGGYVRLIKGGITGHPKTRWVDIDMAPAYDRHGYMVMT